MDALQHTFSIHSYADRQRDCQKNTNKKIDRGTGRQTDVHVCLHPQGALKVYPLPDDGTPEPCRVLSHVPSSKPVDVVVRVYIVRVSISQTQNCGSNFKYPSYVFYQ